MRIVIFAGDDSIHTSGIPVAAAVLEVVGTTVVDVACVEAALALEALIRVGAAMCAPSVVKVVFLSKQTPAGAVKPLLALPSDRVTYF